jgi:hypothetical protein
VSESSGCTVLDVIFSASTTATMIVITTQNIYCFYPRSLIAMTAVSGYRTPLTHQVIDLETQGFTVNFDTSQSVMPCGECCPGVGRRVRGLRGIGKWCWNPTQNGEDNIDQSMIIWHIGDKCHNNLCAWLRHRSFH